MLPLAKDYGLADGGVPAEWRPVQFPTILESGRHIAVEPRQPIIVNAHPRFRVNHFEGFNMHRKRLYKRQWRRLFNRIFSRHRGYRGHWFPPLLLNAADPVDLVDENGVLEFLLQGFVMADAQHHPEPVLQPLQHLQHPHLGAAINWR